MATSKLVPLKYFFLISQIAEIAEIGHIVSECSGLQARHLLNRQLRKVAHELPPARRGADVGHRLDGQDL
jgi:hypothetical protein